jgi:hypothetical protein
MELILLMFCMTHSIQLISLGTESLIAEGMTKAITVKTRADVLEDIKLYMFKCLLTLKRRLCPILGHDPIKYTMPRICQKSFTQKF